MFTRLITFSCFLVIGLVHSKAQCPTGINAFPFTEGFEATNGGWVSGGTGNDWAWGTPSKPVINAAGGGTRCWVIGGLTGSSYTNGEASWLQSPCFDFTNLQYPYLEFKVFWEMEHQFDGASLQYSVDNGTSWQTVGGFNDPINCLNDNWYNFSPITYLSPLTSNRVGWSGNRQPSAGSCRGGNGSNGWVTAKHTMPYLAGRSGVLFRFIFGAGTICNNYDGFAIDDFTINGSPANAASFTYSCLNTKTVNFTNTSALCPTGFSWNFGDPASGNNNTSEMANPSHTFSGTGTYTVTLTVNGPDNAPSTTTQNITIIDAYINVLSKADCQTNTGGSLEAIVTGPMVPLQYSWNTNPVQTNRIATSLGAGVYEVTITGANVCTEKAIGSIVTDLSCIGVYFPGAFTPNNDGRNDEFGPLGSLGAITDYSFSVYNRWGEVVFTSTNPFIKWNGKVKGVATDSNVFVWKAEFVLPGKEKEFRKGTVMLIR